MHVSGSAILDRRENRITQTGRHNGQSSSEGNLRLRPLVESVVTSVMFAGAGLLLRKLLSMTAKS
jgi:hypothetical protein